METEQSLDTIAAALDAEDRSEYTLFWTKVRPASVFGPELKSHQMMSGTLKELEALYQLLQHDPANVDFKATRNLGRELIDRPATGPDGHKHYVGGVAQHHSWKDCPENKDSPNYGKDYDDEQV